MCGIAGFVLGNAIDDARVVLERMTGVLRHRGPDGCGYWHDDTRRIYFGHRRLAIVDVSEKGAQPMQSESGRYVTTFNGEIYNFLTLKKELTSLGHRFRGGSDTEVMLAAFEQWGIARAVDRFVGMFALAVWDGAERKLYLIRDRLGKKPLYYGNAGDALVFASELKSVRLFPGFGRDIDRSAVALFLRHNYVPAPECIYAAARKLTAGTIAEFDCKGYPKLIAERRYWRLSANSRPEVTKNVGIKDAREKFEGLVRDAVQVRMIADVPLGAFLSGGIDSSLVVALMSQASGKPVKTFTIGFQDDEFDEARYARRIAEHLHTDHTELYVTGQQARDAVPRLPEIYDEPFADSSQIPTVLVSRLARSEVTVALSGDGGDELACGYHRYIWMKAIWGAIRTMPLAVRKTVAAALYKGGASFMDAAFRLVYAASRGRIGIAQVQRRLLKLADALAEGDARSVYLQLLSHWRNPEAIVIGAKAPVRDITTTVVDDSSDAMIESLMLTDTENYLPDDVLVKVDRASMATSLEVRAPLLDHRLFEFAREIPLGMHLEGKQGKRILRAILEKYVPKSLFERPKMGFGIPLAKWLRGPLREWAEDLLARERLERDGILRVEPIQRMWRDFLVGRNHGHYLLWDVLMFQSWLEEEKRATGYIVSRRVAATS